MSRVRIPRMRALRRHVLSWSHRSRSISARRFLEIHQTYKKRLCSNDRSVPEDLAHTKILAAIRDHLLSPEGIAHTRKRVAEELRDYSNKLSAELRDRRERLARTEEKMRGRVDFIATGDRSEYV